MFEVSAITWFVDLIDSNSWRTAFILGRASFLISFLFLTMPAYCHMSSWISFLSFWAFLVSGEVDFAIFCELCTEILEISLKNFMRGSGKNAFKVGGVDYPFANLSI